MKKLAIGIIALVFISFILACCVGNQDPQGASRSEKPAKQKTMTAVKMKTSGRIVEMTDTSLKIKRSVKGTDEIFEFKLEKPITKFKVGDKVQVRYVATEDSNVAIKIIKKVPQAVKKTEQPKEKTEAEVPTIEESLPVSVDLV